MVQDPKQMVSNAWQAIAAYTNKRGTADKVIIMLVGMMDSKNRLMAAEEVISKLNIPADQLNFREKKQMNEKQVREAVRSALQKIGNSQVSEGYEDQGEVKDPDKEKGPEVYTGVQESEKPENDKIKEGGPPLRFSRQQTWELYEYLLSVLGPETLVKELIMAMNSAEVAENLQYIASNYDIDLHQLDAEDEDTEDLGRGYAGPHAPAKEGFVPKEKEHLQENKQRLNAEIMKRWGFNKKKKEMLNG